MANQSFKLLSPEGNYHYVVASTIYEAIQKAVALDKYLYSNTAYFKINNVEIDIPQRISLNTDYKLN